MTAIVPSPVPGEKEYIYMFVVSMPLMMILIAAFLKYFKIFCKKITKYFEIYRLLFLFDCSFNIVPGRGLYVVFIVLMMILIVAFLKYF